MFSIGEFSQITGLTIKTLRFYHEQGLLLPTCVDDQSGYRYYDEAKIESARMIAYLRGLEFSVAQIKEILQADANESELLDLVERKKSVLEARIRQLRRAVASLDQFVSVEAKMATTNLNFDVEEKVVQPMLVAGVRMKGRYYDCGQGFARIGRQFGRNICGKCFLLHYDAEYRESDADFEACMPVSKAKAAEGIAVRELPGGACVALLHKGPYDQLGRSYARILKYIHDKGYTLVRPTREVYLKGPGMLFKGNPKNYLTEIQMLVEQGAAKQAHGA